jgi:hypothetical protein
MREAAKTLVSAVLLSLAAGCATYTTPGAGVVLGNLSRADPDIAQLMKAEPAAAFPARMAVARVQAPGYSSRSAGCYGTGDFCVVTVRDIEPEASYQKLSKLPRVSGLALINRMLLPAKLTSTKDLRQGAATLKADVLLIYSLDTRFNIENTDVGPLALITLGFLPNKKAQVRATASAAMYDVRTGFVYGVAESTAAEEQRATFWSSTAAVDTARQKAESEAFHKLIGEVARLWDDVLTTHASEARVAGSHGGGR